MLTEEQREKLTERLAGIDKAAEAIRIARKPLDDAMNEVQGLREAILEEYEAEIIDNCEHCDRLILQGDKGYRYADGPALCEACAPTYGTLKDTEPEAYEEAEDHAATLAMVEAHVAAGGSLDDKYIYPL